MTNSVFSKDFKGEDLKIDDLLKLLDQEIKKLEKSKPVDIKKYKSFMRDKKKKKNFQSLRFSIKINDSDNDKLLSRAKNIVTNGGVDSLYTLSNNVGQKLSNLRIESSILSDLISNAQNDIQPAKTQNPSIAQVKDFNKMFVNSLLFTFEITGGSSASKNIRIRHQIEQLNETKVAISKLKDTTKLTAKIEGSPEVSQTDKEESSKSEPSDEGAVSKMGKMFQGFMSSGQSSSESEYTSRPQNVVGEQEVPQVEQRELPESNTAYDNKQISSLQSDNLEQGVDSSMDGDIKESQSFDQPDSSEEVGNTKSFYDTVLSYFSGDSTEDKTDEDSEDSDDKDTPPNATDLVKSLDVTGLFSKDKSFVPTENDTQKIEIAESELKMLQESEESLKQELEEQEERIKEYKKDIQNKISQQYALLEYEKSQLKGENKRFNRKQYEKYNKLVDMLKNRERFLDKREDILNGKRKKDLKELKEMKKNIVSELLRQLDREKNIVIKSKNKENSILRKQLQYYKGNNMYLQSLVEMLEENKCNKANVKRVKRTLKKRKKQRLDQYTQRNIFEITL